MLYPVQLVQFMREHGRRKVLFGTNYPMITPEKALVGLDALGLADAALKDFLGANAQSVFDL